MEKVPNALSIIYFDYTAEMKILVISQHLHPMQTPRAHRTTELVKELARQGHEVTVYAVLGKYDYTEFQKENGVKVKNIPIRWMWHAYNSDDDKRRTLFDKVLMRLFHKNFEFPEIEFRYRIPQILKKDWNYDLLLSIGAPHHIHWGVARYRKHNSNRFPAYWIADCGDPFMMNNTTNGHRPRYEKEERLFCELADRITVPVESAKSAYYQEYRSKIEVIPQGFQIDVITNNSEPSNTVPTFAYAGTFYRDIRNPSTFLKYLASVEIDFRFIVYSAHTELIDPFKEAIGDKLIIRKPIPRQELIQELSKMDFLINIENHNSPAQVPSKLIDYALTGRPILSIDPVIFENQVVDQFLKRDYSNQLHLLDIDQYRIHNVANKFLALINR